MDEEETTLSLGGKSYFDIQWFIGDSASLAKLPCVGRLINEYFSRK